jgi:hypothetical protein
VLAIPTDERLMIAQQTLLLTEKTALSRDPKSETRSRA